MLAVRRTVPKRLIDANGVGDDENAAWWRPLLRLQRIGWGWLVEHSARRYNAALEASTQKTVRRVMASCKD